MELYSSLNLNCIHLTSALETIQLFLFTFTPWALMKLSSINGTPHYSKGRFLNICISVFQHFCESLGLSLHISKCAC